jgi:DNA replication protein DnaC
MQEELKSLCKTLKLSQHLAQNCYTLQGESHAAFACQLFSAEVAYRDRLRKLRLYQQASFPVAKSFENYTWDQIKLPDALSQEDLTKAQSIDRKENLILYGRTGTGKSHLAVALGTYVTQQGKAVRFYRTATLVNQLVEARKEGGLKKLLKSFSNLSLLILDEFGFVPLDREGGQLLFQVVSECYEKRSVIITTNLEFSRWVNVLYDASMTAAMIDRLVHHGHLVIFDGESYRLKHALMKA